MDDSAVVPGLVPGKLGLFLQEKELEARINFCQQHGGGQSDDAATYDSDVILI